MNRLARGFLGDASGAVADLGVLVPIAAALVRTNGFDPATLFVCAGAFALIAGLAFRVPVPVQPIKAAAAIAIAKGLAPATLAAAGVMLGAVLLVLSLTGAATIVQRLFTKPVVRGLQLGVGLILVRSAVKLLGPSPAVTVWVWAVVIAGLMLIGARASWPLALALVAGGVAYSIAQGATLSLHAAVWHPHLARVFEPERLWLAATLLVLPQIPLTLGNAVVAVVDLEREYFGSRARRVTARSVSLSCGAANVVTGVLGGMPMCHGSNGLTAHYRAGARTWRMNAIIGGAMLVLGLAFGPTALGLLALLPAAVLAGMLTFGGLMHAALVRDLRGFELAVAIVMGAIGVVTSNLALALACGLLLGWGVRFVNRERVAPAPR